MTRPRKQEGSRLVTPRIDRIVEPVITPGTAEFLKEGKPLTSARPGAVLMLAGRGFGQNPAKAVVNFGRKTADAFPKPLFSETYILVTTPLIPKGSTAISVTIAGGTSNELTLLIQSLPASPKPAGTLIKKAVSTFDAFIVLVAAEMGLADFGSVASNEYKKHIITTMLEARRGLLVPTEKLDNLDAMGDEVIEILEIKDQQAQDLLRRTGRNVAGKVRLLFDEITDTSRIIPRLQMEMNRLRHGGKSNFTAGLEGFAEAATGVGNFFDSLESAAGSLSLSGEAGIAAGIELGGDTEVDSSALAAAWKMVAETIASLLKIGAIISGQVNTNSQENEETAFRNAVATKFSMAEAKLDSQGATIASIDGKVAKLEEKADKQGGAIATLDGKLNKLEEKADKQGGAISSIDTQIKKGEVKKDRIEGKLDKAEVKLDRIEEKLDKNEIKKDRIEAKLDKLEPKLDKLEGKADKAEGKLDKLERKADRTEGKLDKLEPKIDKLEPKLDKLEGKADKAEGKLDKLEPKLDKLEGKADKAEGKLDKLERKADRTEGKLDKLEPKIDKLEPKLDKLEPKMDRLQVSSERAKEFWQFESAAWNVDKANRVGVKVQSSILLPGPTTPAFNVESIQVINTGFKIIKVIVDDLPKDISGLNIVTPANVMVDIGIGLIGASRSVKIEFDKPYSGPVEFNGEKPQGLKLCTVVEGTGSSQNSPSACTAT